jgi:hypothetical protein
MERNWNGDDEMSNHARPGVQGWVDDSSESGIVRVNEGSAKLPDHPVVVKTGTGESAFSLLRKSL